MNDWLDLLSWSFLLAGSFFGISGGVGILRFPDFFTRLHAAGVTDTMCTALILVGLMIQTGLNVILVKLLLTLAFLLLTSPTATHSLAKAALHGKIEQQITDGEKASSKS